MFHRAWTLSPLALLLLCACPQEITTPGEQGVDAGAGVEDALASDSLGGGDTSLPGEDASSSADAQGADAAQPDTAVPDTGLTPLRWSEMLLPDDTASVTAIWGRSGDEVYAGTSNGNVLRFDRTGGWQIVWHEENNFGIRALWGTATRLFVASTGLLWVHENGIQTTPQRYNVGSWTYDMSGVSDTEVYLVADRTNGRAFYRYDGDSVDLLIEPTGVATLGAVHANGPGDVYVGGNGHMFRYSSFVLEEETVDWNPTWSSIDILQFTFYDITVIGSRVFAMGDRFLIWERDGTGTWQRVHEPFLTEDLEAMAGFELAGGEGLEAYAVGGNATGGPILRYYRDTWSSDQSDLDVTLYDVWAAGPDEYFAAGTVSNTFTGVILRGSR